MKQEKIIIYQIFTRLFSNRNTTCKPDGTLQENGCGKMNDIDSAVLSNIRKLGVTHVWYTGIIRHATQTDYSAYGIPRQHDVVVKGKAGSPYAITDYYDVDPDLAVNVDKRMDELQDLLHRTHQAGLKAIIDFVPNHVAREYKSICKPEGIKDLGENDDPQSQKRTKRAPFSEASMSSAPASTCGWLAMKPTVRPAMRPKPMTRFLAKLGAISKKYWWSHTGSMMSLML